MNSGATCAYPVREPVLLSTSRRSDVVHGGCLPYTGDCDGIAVCGKFVDVIVSSIDSSDHGYKRLLIIALLLPSCIVADASQASAVVSRSCSLKRCGR